MPVTLYNKVSKLAKDRGVPVKNVVNQLLTIGLDLLKYQKKGYTLIIEKGDDSKIFKIYI